MSILHLIKCEMCPNQFEILPFQPPYEWAMPGGWYILFPDRMRGSEGRHFCSDACLSQWVEKRLAEDEQERKVVDLLTRLKRLGCTSAYYDPCQDALTVNEQSQCQLIFSAVSAHLDQAGIDKMEAQAQEYLQRQEPGA